MRSGPGKNSVQGPGPPTAVHQIPVMPKSGGLPAVAHGPKAWRSLLPPPPACLLRLSVFRTCPWLSPLPGRFFPLPYPLGHKVLRLTDLCSQHL